ncbi:transcriptional regulator, ArgR family [Austwickia chelonae]|uniref:Arginine repressor n=1 Tax=Austwickia chelonae NBRC 105200 TaxID=1184607 RepID=K6VIX4_9MICO|nr:arginine repressor [Austwickia chelonae]GAB76684.1 arginine repressor [Austwickia chelonae NBRC 105200]SEW29251.1 transcriptional regulator, ArgR family [Austwickia chelonae]
MLANTKSARHQLIADILARYCVHSQSELLQRLAEHGVVVTQATLSRDLVALRAVKVRKGRKLVYALPGLGGDTTPRPAPDERTLDHRLRHVCEEFIVSAVPVKNFVVVRTPPGAADYVASVLDQNGGLGALGTIAGDDTTLLVFRDDTAAAEVSELLLDNSGRPRS